MSVAVDRVLKRMRLDPNVPLTPGQHRVATIYARAFVRERKQRRRKQAVYAIAATLGFAVGFTLGGWLL